MTDEQWVWLFANESLDEDEKLASLCGVCRTEVTSGVHKCTKCGKVLTNSDNTENSFVNPNFDEDKFISRMYGEEEDAIRKVDDNIG